MSIQLSTRVMHVKDQSTGTYDTVDILKGSGIDDVQIDGNSIVDSDGVANVPKASTSVLGVVMTSPAYGTAMIYADGILRLDQASVSQIKAGTQGYKPIVPEHQHEATFYGLAKAAGDTSQSSSTYSVGTYTDSAKTAIKNMLDITQDGVHKDTISGTTPSITALPSHRYVCGEIATLSFTPPSDGITQVMFTSGTTPTVITFPNTVIFPAWFDPTDLESDTVYDIVITDGVYGSVMSWAL